MPLVDLAHTPPYEDELRRAAAYGLPKTYPIALNGLADGVNMVRVLPAPKVTPYDRPLKYGYLPSISLVKQLFYRIKPELPIPPPPPVYGESLPGKSMFGLGCGGDCGCKDCKDTYGSTGYPGPGYPTGMSDWVPTEAEVKAGVSTDPLGQQYFQAQKPSPPAGGGVQAFNQIFDKITSTIMPFVQAKQNKPPRPKVVVQQQPDWIMPAVIVGGVIVAGVLAATIARKR